MRGEGTRSIVDTYKYYKKKHKKDHVDYTTYRQICNDFNQMFVQELFEGKIKDLYNGLGKIYICKLPTDYTKPCLDYKSTKELGKKVYHTNIHSDGFYARFIWVKARARTKRVRKFIFTPTWANKRALASIMKTPGGHKKFLIRQNYIK
jgi:hypothetical protein